MNKHLTIWEKFIGSAFLTGYVPVASGTVGSIAALVIYLIPGFERLYILLPAIIAALFYGIYLGDKFENEYGKDPSECTIDEVVGMWISLIAIPKELVPVLLTFVLWRIFDIIKPPPARTIEAWKGGKGIMLDDVVAGVYALVIMHLLLAVTDNFSFL